MDPELLTVVAVFRARPGHEIALGAALRAMLLPTRREEGCLNYDLHQADDPGLFFFHETWESVDHHRAHLDTPHVHQLLAITSKLLLEPIRELKGRRIEA
ncbi:MAG: antibiotic biosynthesis monooxygenase [Chloroflexota bacterium]|nr:antibiotic biosynthesis monooxygenase [Chloroflexota bacterium]